MQTLFVATSIIALFLSHPLSAKEPTPSRLSYSTDGSILAVSTRDHVETVVYQADNLHPIVAFQDKARVGDIAFGESSRILATGAGSQVRLWDIETRKEVTSFQEDAGEILSIDYSPTGSYLASGSFRGTMRIWDVRQHKLLWTYDNGGPFQVEAVAFSPDERLVASLLNDTYLRLWNLSTQDQVGLFRGALVGAIAFSPDSQSIAAGSERSAHAEIEHAVRIWDIASETQIADLKGHTDRIESVAFNKDGSLLVTASRDSTVRLWDVAMGQEIARIHRTAPVGAASFHPNTDVVASVDWKGLVSIWDWQAEATVVTPISWGKAKAGK